MLDRRAAGGPLPAKLDWYLNRELRREEGYSTNLLAAAAVRFIEQQVGGGPFFCYVPFNAPHYPLQAPQEYLDRYKHLKTRQTYAAMVTCLDDGIGRILAAIDQLDDAQPQRMLFRIDSDPLEQHDVSAAEPELTQQLYKRLKSFRALRPTDK